MKINSADISSAIAKIHKHKNNIIEKITEEQGKMLYDNKPLSSDELTDILLGLKINELQTKEALTNSDCIFVFDENNKNIKKINFLNFNEIPKNESYSKAVIANFISLDQNIVGGTFNKKLEYLNLETASNSVEFGELINNRINGAMSASKSKAYIIGGFTYGTSKSNCVHHKKIEFVNFSSLSNSSDFGTMLTGRKFPSCVGHENFCLIHGSDPLGLYGYRSFIEQINYATAVATLLSVYYDFTTKHLETTKCSIYAVGTPIKGVFSTMGESASERFTINYSNLTLKTLYGTLGTSNVEYTTACGGAAGNKLQAIYEDISFKFYSFLFATEATTTQTFKNKTISRYNCCVSDNIKAVFFTGDGSGLHIGDFATIHSVYFSSIAGISEFGNLMHLKENVDNVISAASNSHGGLYY